MSIQRYILCDGCNIQIFQFTRSYLQEQKGWETNLKGKDYCSGCAERRKTLVQSLKSNKKAK